MYSWLNYLNPYENSKWLLETIYGKQDYIGETSKPYLPSLSQVISSIEETTGVSKYVFGSVLTLGTGALIVNSLINKYQKEAFIKLISETDHIYNALMNAVEQEINDVATTWKGQFRAFNTLEGEPVLTKWKDMVRLNKMEDALKRFPDMLGKNQSEIETLLNEIKAKNTENIKKRSDKEIIQDLYQLVAEKLFPNVNSESKIGLKN